MQPVRQWKRQLECISARFLQKLSTTLSSDVTAANQSCIREVLWEQMFYYLLHLYLKLLGSQVNSYLLQLTQSHNKRYQQEARLPPCSLGCLTGGESQLQWSSPISLHPLCVRDTDSQLGSGRKVNSCNQRFN